MSNLKTKFLFGTFFTLTVFGSGCANRHSPTSIAINAPVCDGSQADCDPTYGGAIWANLSTGNGDYAKCEEGEGDCYPLLPTGPTKPSGTILNSVGSQTKDVDLQRAQLQQQNLEARAQAVAGQFQMNIESARQLTQLSDRLQLLTTSGQLTDDDRASIADSALNVAGIQNTEVTQAYAAMLNNGDKTAVNALVEKAAVNLGMPSSAGLRDQILPSLGIHL